MLPTDYLPASLRYHRPNQPLRLASGVELPSPTIAYQTWGRLNARRDNVIWVCHALTASTAVPDWWPALFGPGKALDPDRYFIVCANVLGGCYGSCGPSSDRGDGRPWGGDFPELTIADLVAHQRLLLEHLDLRGIELVLGGSMGGFQALEWALQEPNRVRRLGLVATSWRQPADAVALAELQCALVRADPDYADGHYDPAAGPRRGLALARQLGHYSYRAADEFEQRFGRAQREDGRLQVLSYLDHQGDKLVRRFDANSYLCLSAAMNRFDLAERGPIESVMGRIQQPTLVVAIDSDRLYPPREQAQLAQLLPQARLLQIESTRGHDGFLADAHRFEPLLREWLQAAPEVDAKTTRAAAEGLAAPSLPDAPPAAASAAAAASRQPLRVIARGEGHAQRPLVLIGASGRVGSALLGLLQARSETHRLIAVANRSGALLRSEGLSPGTALAELQQPGPRLPLGALGAQLPAGSVLIDATAAAAVAECYGEWLDQGHALVAANKLAFAGPQWPRLATQLPRIGCSAVVGAGLPILASVRRLLASGDRLLALQASLSGTLSFVLDQLQLGQSLPAAVSAAVELGLAEPDPAADLGGEDVARKLLVILRCAGLAIERAQIELEPLLPPRPKGQSPQDWLAEGDVHWRARLARARSAGLQWVYRASFDGAAARVGPVAVPADDPLAGLRGAANRALLWSEFHGEQPLLIAGNGAGPRITAAALLADVAALPAGPDPAPREVLLRRIA